MIAKAHPNLTPRLRRMKAENPRLFRKIVARRLAERFGMKPTTPDPPGRSIGRPPSVG